MGNLLERKRKDKFYGFNVMFIVKIDPSKLVVFRTAKAVSSIRPD